MPQIYKYLVKNLHKVKTIDSYEKSQRRPVEQRAKNKPLSFAAANAYVPELLFERRKTRSFSKSIIGEKQKKATQTLFSPLSFDT